MAVNRDELVEQLDELLNQYDAKKVKVKVKTHDGERFDVEVRDNEED